MTKRGVCDVHDLTTVGGDKTVRDVGYCGGCGAWICAECKPDKKRRAKAMAKRAMRRLRAGLGLGPKEGE